MSALPTQDLRANILTLAVPTCQAPAVARAMLESLPREQYDPGFRGQELATTYFDTPGFALRKARRRGDKYLTLRVRCYQPAGAYALSAKTEDQKFRREISAQSASALLAGGDITQMDLLPASLVARLMSLANGDPVGPVVTVLARRYAVEDQTDRLTLDLDVRTDSGKCLERGVLEFKSTVAGAEPPAALIALGLRPVKISKFLWATLWR
jgi:hypothetical protein